MVPRANTAVITSNELRKIRTQLTQGSANASQVSVV